MNGKAWSLCLMEKILRVGWIEGIAANGHTDSFVPFLLNHHQHVIDHPNTNHKVI